MAVDEVASLFETLDGEKVGYVKTEDVRLFLMAKLLHNTPLSLHIVSYMIDGKEGVHTMMNAVCVRMRGRGIMVGRGCCVEEFGSRAARVYEGATCG